MLQAEYVEVSAAVRYWEDAHLNGQEDEAGNIPLREGELWKPVIHLETGRVMDWPEGVEAQIHYKVCDEGEYWLQDRNRQRIAKWKGYYVPDDVLCVGTNGLGDYIIFDVNAQGMIVDWTRPPLDPDRWLALEALPSSG